MHRFVELSVPGGMVAAMTEVGPVIFGDPDERFAGLVAILADGAGRLRAAVGEVI